MKRCLLLLVVLLSFLQATSQCNVCSATSFNVDISAVTDTVYKIQSTRSGNCCTGTNCIKFTITLNPGSTYVNFSVINPAPNGSAYYQIDCGPQTSLGTPICISGRTTVCIVYCKPGNDNPTYIITAASALKASPDITLRQGCSGTLNSNGLIESTIRWTSIFPGAPGAYNSYLSCTSACSTTTVTPAAGAPAYIDYLVSGSDPCSGLGADTIRVYTTHPLNISVSPVNPFICTGSGATVTLNASAIGGKPPYNYLWSTGQSTSSITTANTGTYTVTVTDSVQNCPAITNSLIVQAIAPPPAPVLSSSDPVCPGDQINLYASSITGATYQWSGPNGFTSNQQNPVIASASVLHGGTYTVVATVNGCAGPSASLNLVVNFPPAVSAASSNSPVCLGGIIQLTATSSTNASFSWTGPNNFISNLQNPTISNAELVNAGMYNVVASLNGCLSGTTSVPITINPPQTPVATNQSDVCEGGIVNLFTTPVNGATQYQWSGPGGFSVSTQNPVLQNVTMASAGIYTVLPVIPGCTAFPDTTLVVIKPTPAPPILSSNSAVCTGATLQLQAAGPTGATYSWTGPSSYNSTAQNPVIVNATILHAGNYQANATLNGCTSDVATIPVVVNVPPSVPVISNNNPVCLGGIIELSATSTPGATFSWSGPDGFTSSLYNPTIPNAATTNGGVYTVTASLNGCVSGVASVAISITPPPVSVATSNSALCEGDSLKLYSSTVAGATLYNWTGPNGFISTTQNPTLANAALQAAGTYSVTPIIPGCMTLPASTIILVKPTPAPPVLTSNSALCIGATILLHAAGPAGATYSWTGPNSYNSTAQNPVINNATVLNAGSYLANATLNGCTGAAAAIPVVVNVPPFLPVINGNSPVCLGGAIQLSATSTPGATFYWRGPNGFTSSLANPTIPNAATTNGGVYTVTATLNGCVSGEASIAVSITPPPVSSVTSNSPICEGDSLKLYSSTVAGAIQYNWTGPNGFTSTTQNPVLANASLQAAGTYTVTPTIPGCVTFSASATVAVKPTPATPVATNTGPLCTGSTLILQASGPVQASYQWAGPNGFNSAIQNPAITNVTPVEAGLYNVIATVNGCVSLPASTNVVVNPIPAPPAATSNGSVCQGSMIRLFATTVANASYLWTGPNNYTNTSQNPVITSASSIHNGNYSVSVTVNGCTSISAATQVQVNAIPLAPVVTSNSPVCQADTIQLGAATIAGGSYSWVGPNGYTSNEQNPVKLNALSTYAGLYTATVSVNGCASPASAVTVLIKPTPLPPGITSNSPICEGSTLNLSANAVGGTAAITWTGPGGFTSTSNTNSIGNATAINSGSYTATATLNGCTSEAADVNIFVQQPAVVNAGLERVVCPGLPVQLNGVVSGGTNTGVWSSAGSGNFSPSTTNLNSRYNLSPADLAAGSVLLTLTSTNNGACTTSAHSIRLNITPSPAVNAGQDHVVCYNNAAVYLNGFVERAGSCNWKTSGSGIFFPSDTSMTATYLPSIADKNLGKITLTLSATSLGTCAPTDSALQVTILPGPKVNAGPDRFVLLNQSVVINPSYTGAGLQYLWTPALFLNSDTVAAPLCSPIRDQQYVIKVTDALGCMASDTVIVKVLLPLKIPNVFSPNGDGVNDKWIITNIDKYPNARVEIFSRYGQKVFSSVQYPNPWDGTYNGSPLPIGVYYYVIDPKNGLTTIGGSITILR